MAKHRTKRDIFMEPTDPKFPQQWYLVSARQGLRAAGRGGELYSHNSKFWGSGHGTGGMAAAASQAGGEEEGLRQPPGAVDVGTPEGRDRAHGAVAPCGGAGPSLGLD